MLCSSDISVIQEFSKALQDEFVKKCMPNVLGIAVADRIQEFTEEYLCVDQSGFDASETRGIGKVPSKVRKGAA